MKFRIVLYRLGSRHFGKTFDCLATAFRAADSHRMTGYWTRVCVFPVDECHGL